MVGAACLEDQTGKGSGCSSHFVAFVMVLHHSLGTPAFIKLILRISSNGESTDFHLTSSAMPSGFTIDSILAIVILKIYWLKEELSSAESRYACGTQSTRCAHGAGSASSVGLYLLED